MNRKIIPPRPESSLLGTLRSFSFLNATDTFNSRKAIAEANIGLLLVVYNPQYLPCIGVMSRLFYDLFKLSSVFSRQ